MSNDNTSYACFCLLVQTLTTLSFFRWSAFVDNGKIKSFNVEEVPSDFKVSGAEVILDQI